ncbi:hypothetical protein WMY93_031791 [Mugilogobius chulae]|uniref:Uncharacterized protein n=1 Tax=Mugilogobius chulae TaxID=88201 RepID=A0AAW0ML19_9GOBI
MALDHYRQPKYLEDLMEIVSTSLLACSWSSSYLRLCTRRPWSVLDVVVSVVFWLRQLKVFRKNVLIQTIGNTLAPTQVSPFSRHPFLSTCRNPESPYFLNPRYDIPVLRIFQSPSFINVAFLTGCSGSAPSSSLLLISRWGEFNTTLRVTTSKGEERSGGDSDQDVIGVLSDLINTRFDDVPDPSDPEKEALEEFSQSDVSDPASDTSDIDEDNLEPFPQPDSLDLDVEALVRARELFATGTLRPPKAVELEDFTQSDRDIEDLELFPQPDSLDLDVEALCCNVQ